MSGLTGTGTLLRLALRRDRVVLPICIVLLVLLAGGSAQAALALYPTPEELTRAAEAVNASPAIVAMFGPISDPTNPGAIASFKTVSMGAIFVALLAYALVRRHTRTEEEAGRTELVGAAVVGRRAPLTAAVVLAIGACVVTSVVVVLSLVGLGLDAPGSIGYGLYWLSAGLAFTGITAIAVQLTQTARGASAWALGALGVAYVLRAIGDSSQGALSWLTWLSPLGWGEKLDIYGANRFVVFLIPLVFTVASVGVAYALRERRDLGAGLVAGRAGPARASASLSSPLALAWRLQRGAFIGWAIAYALLGLVLGSVAHNVGDFVSDPKVEEMLRQLGGSASSLSDVYLGAELNFLAIGAAAYGISAALRLRSEEAEGHSEQVLATRTSRPALLGSHALIALGGSALLLVVTGLGMALSYGRASGGVGATLGRLLPSVLAPIPAVWVCVGLALVVFGALPRLVVLAWAVLAVFVVVGEFGSILKLPQAVIDVSPFVHASVPPGGSVSGVPLAALLLIAAALAAAAVGAFRRRDLTTA
ncbi:MAG: polyketide antibiotic transporter [Intrasporangium sp.]|uniref:ABC transporter permease n=1 Tax=Intrasporangium sp. TaxID=1925024 RepID=UPI0026479E0F|nr:polyketide antibiotic transporter [Intrasporangium sp.]MDN5796262.1 polyketide antibiotic transporter [Intrasporangium sp.]